MAEHYEWNDLDGTLAKDVWPDTGIGEPIRENVGKLTKAIYAGYKVVIYTSRSWEMYETIEAYALPPSMAESAFSEVRTDQVRRALAGGKQ